MLKANVHSIDCQLRMRADLYREDGEINDADIAGAINLQLGRDHTALVSREHRTRAGGVEEGLGETLDVVCKM